MNVSVLKSTIKQLPRLMIGFVIISFGTILTLKSDMGLNPWGTLHQGISIQTGLTFGLISQLIGIVIIIFSLILKIYPGVGTILNMIFIGFFVDLFNNLNLVPENDSLIIRIVYLLTGTFLFNYGIYIYLSCQLGAGPRDGLMVGLVKITGISVSIIRPIIEVTVVVTGILLGGSYGIGTLLNAFGGGYILNSIFRFYRFNPKKVRQMVITDFIAVREVK